MSVVWKRLVLSWAGVIPVGILVFPAIATAEMFPALDSLVLESGIPVLDEGAIAPPLIPDPVVADSVTFTPLVDAPVASPDIAQASSGLPSDSSDSNDVLDAATDESPPVVPAVPEQNDPDSEVFDEADESDRTPEASTDLQDANSAEADTLGTESLEPSTPEASADALESESSETNAPEADSSENAEVLTPEEQAEAERLQLLIQGDRLYLEGRIAEAEAVYRQAKLPIDPSGILAIREGVANSEDDPDSADAGSDENVLEVGIHTASPENTEIRDPHENSDALPPAASVYWREALAGRETQSISRTLVALKLLSEQYPEFIPGHTLYAQVLREQEQYEDAAEVLERATSIYPNHLDLATARIQTLESDENWLQASLAARQFATFNPDHNAAAAMTERADENLDRFRRQIRNRITTNTIANAITGAISYAATGTLLGPLSALDSALLLLRGESTVGESAANSASDRLDIIEDPEVNEYVDTVGQKLAALAGRDEFEYEFYVIDDDSLNAFALPGGKIFINSGAILRTDSEAQLAGLLAHELAHAVLSHGFQMVTTGNMTSSLLLNVPNGDLFNALTLLDYSRDMERQADDLGTRILAAAGYAADGLYYLMVTLDEENGRGGWSWLSSHPATIERVRNIATQIQENGYNRYAYEGVEQHQQIQDRLEQLAAAEEEAQTDEDDQIEEAQPDEEDMSESESNDVESTSTDIEASDTEVEASELMPDEKESTLK